MIIQKLQAMDIVLRRDGLICWILKDTISGRLRLFDLELYGYHLLKNYNCDFTYGKHVNLEDLDEIEMKNIRDYDIVAVSGLNSEYDKLWTAKNYEKSIYIHDKERQNMWFEMFKWVFTDAYFIKNTYSGD